MKYMIFTVAALFSFSLSGGVSAQAETIKQEQAQMEAFDAIQLALSQKNYDSALELMKAYRQDFIINSDNGDADDKKYQLILADKDEAFAMGRGKLGDPCKLLASASDGVIDFSELFYREERHRYSEAVAFLQRNVDELIAEFSCAKAIAGKPDKAAAGIYYLGGVMETASGMNLQDDGRYQWFLSVGSVDMQSAGYWRKKDQTIQLIADPFPVAPQILTPQEKTVYTAPLDLEYWQEIQGRDVKPNYAISILESPNQYAISSSPIVFLEYAGGRRELAGFVNNQRLDIYLDADDLPKTLVFAMRIGTTAIEEKFDVEPSPGIIQPFSISKAKITDLGFSSTIFILENGLLMSQLFDYKSAYISREKLK